jgi:hypothetical protein
MNLPEAHDTARSGAARFGNTWRVFRLPAWPGGVYSCKACDLPAEAHIVATYPNEGQAFRPASAPADAGQGSLF